MLTGCKVINYIFQIGFFSSAVVVLQSVNLLNLFVQKNSKNFPRDAFFPSPTAGLDVSSLRRKRQR